MFSDKEEFKRYVRDLPWDDAVNHEHREQLLADLLYALNQQKGRVQKTARRRIRLIRLTRIGAAAAVILAAIILWHHYTGSILDPEFTDAPTVEDVAKAAGIVRARLLDVSDSQRREKDSVLWNTRWEVAEAVGTSEYYLSRIFNQDLGLSPWTYLKRLRMLHAKALLHETDRSIKVIARQVGINDPAYFSRVFNQETGLPPSVYRKKSRL